jgi:putative ATPase
MTGESPELFTVAEPLAARMRPTRLEEVLGQEHLLAPGKSLGDAIRRGDLGSVVFWGPPGAGKTTLARLVAQYTDRHFVAFSAVTDGVARVREILRESEERRRHGRGTILFCDEIHRFNRAQQDAFLPPVERGVITLIGATTENPSFALTGALLSRCRVYVLEPLAPEAIRTLLEAALADPDRGLGRTGVHAGDEALDLLAAQSQGDARRALNVLEAAVAQTGPGDTLAEATVRDVLARRLPLHDRAGEAHYNLLSAYHKSLRGSDPQGALYWMARALEGGEDPLVLFRRAIAMAAEDIGLADPQALPLAVAARDAFLMLGAPEGYLPLAEMTIYLATAPKSNSTIEALQSALAAARETGDLPVPAHLRNAPTALMKELGYGTGYRYDHDVPGHHAGQHFLPEPLRGSEFYRPGGLGFERTVAERLAWWSRRAREAAGGEESSGR